MVHGDPKRSGGCLLQTSTAVGLGLGGELNLFLAGSTHPAGQPLSCQAGLRGPQSPGTRPDEHLSTQSAELLDRDRHRVRAEQVSAGRAAALVRVRTRRRSGDPKGSAGVRSTRPTTENVSKITSLPRPRR